MSRRACSERSRRSGRRSGHSRERGVALIVAILLVALGTIVAASLAYNSAMTARRTAAAYDFDQALLVEEGAEALAAYGLEQTTRMNSPYTYPGQPWSRPLPPTEVIPGVMLEASLEDAQGRFNLNDLVQSDGNTANAVAIRAFQRLLVKCGLDPKWADYLVDWIDKNTTPMFPDGAEDSVYLELNPPYRTPNLPITSATEMLALPGFTRQDFDRIAPYIIALPIGVPVNVCSASPTLLDALTGVEQFSTNPQQFDQDRKAAGTCFPTQQAVLTAATNVKNQGPPLPPGSPDLASLIAQKSSWFQLVSFITQGSTEFSVYTLLYLDPTGHARPIQRSFTPH